MKDLEPEQALVREAASGDEPSWKAIVGATCSRLYALLCYQVGDREEALDLLQETYLQAFRHLREFRREAPLEVWLRVIALRKAVDWKRSALRRLRRTVRLSDRLAAPSEPESDLGFATERAALQGALARLSPVQRAVFLLREWEGWTFREIAQRMGIKETTARVHHARARARLRRLLGRGPLGDRAREREPA